MQYKNQMQNTDKSLRGEEEEERQKPSQLFHTENQIFFHLIHNDPLYYLFVKPQRLYRGVLFLPLFNGDITYGPVRQAHTAFFCSSQPKKKQRS